MSAGFDNDGLHKRVAASANVIDMGSQPLVDVEVEETQLVDLDDYLLTFGYSRIATAPTDPIYREYQTQPAVPMQFDAIVAADGTGDFTSIATALAAGNDRLFVRNGTYVETADMSVPQDGCIFGETPGAVLIVPVGGVAVKIDGSGRQVTGGTVSLVTGSTGVVGIGTTFTGLQPDDYLLVTDIWYQIASITDDLNLVLGNPYNGRALSGLAFEGQSMIEGAAIVNLIIANGTAEGLIIRQAAHVIVRDSLVTNCGDVATTRPTALLEDTGELFLLGLIVSASKYDGLTFRRCRSVVVQTCEVRGSANDGFVIDDCNAIILDGCVSAQNGREGFTSLGTTTRVNITDSISLQNVGDGMKTAPTTGTAVIDGCTIRGNGGHGIDFDGEGNGITDCSITENDGDGISAGDYGRINDNYIANNGGEGIAANNDRHCTISTNVIRDNGSHGIILGRDGTCSGNQVVGNGGDGIRTAKADAILNGNRCRDNALDGINIEAAATDAIVTSNNCQGNTGASITDSGTGTIQNSNKV
jgi:hypothetical protein